MKGTNALRTLVVAWLVAGGIAAAPARAVTCGDRVVELPEECDDGGVCIGSDNAGTACTSDSQCPGGTCKTFGGDGCAANCTFEQDVLYRLVPGQVVGSGLQQSLTAGTSGIVASAGFLGSIAIPLDGQLVLTIGKERDGQIPVVVKSDSVRFPPVEVSVIGFTGCGCAHGAAVKTCGGTFLDTDGSVAPDCTDDPTVCEGRKPCTYLHGPGNTLSGVIGCNGLSNANLSYTVDMGGELGGPLPPVITLSGEGSAGAAVVTATIGLDVFLASCSGQGPKQGPDGQLCTADDGTPDAQVNASNFAVTGTATAALVNFPGGDAPIEASTSGSPFACGPLAAGNPGGAMVVSAFALPDLANLASAAVTLQLAAQPNETTPACTGDCGNDGEVTVNEIIMMVNVALGSQEVSSCGAGDADGNGEITVDEIIAAVNRALNGC